MVSGELCRRRFCDERRSEHQVNNGVEIPQFGFEVFQIERSQTVGAVRAAFEAGYRHVDTAQMYGNEAEVGRAIEESGLPRGEVFVATKLHNHRPGHDPAIAAPDESLERLRTDYVDLYLIHRPMPPEDRYVETWTAFEKLLADGRARAIGVSNVGLAQLDRLAGRTATVPAVNQVEVHPNFQQPELRSYHREHGIATEAWRWRTRRSLGSPGSTASRRRRWSCGGTSSSGTARSRNP